MTSRQLLRVGPDQFRVGPWHADDRIAYLALPPPMSGPSVEGLHGCLRSIEAAGYSSVITSALHPAEAAPFLEAGFSEYDRLRVLSHDLSDLDRLRNETRRVRLRRARRVDRGDALAVDNRAFPVFWRLDRAAMTEAERATPVCRFRVAVPERGSEPRVLGYAVTGRGSGQGFLQRLAVDPDHSGHGIGTALVVDALRWAARRRCRRVLVNTQRHNTRALALYRRLGFEVTATDLLVLHRPVP